MVRHDSVAPHSACHPKVWELLPWHVNGTLGGPERDAVDERLATCASCRAELARCHELAAAVLAAPDPGWSPSPAHVSRLLARVERDDTHMTQVGAWWARLRDQSRGALSRLRPAPPILRWALVTEGALVVVLALVVVWQASSSASLYQTLSRSGESASQRQGQIRVAFADDITEREFRALLTSVGGTLVGGPSPLAIYTVQIEPAAGAADRVGAILEQLRAHPKVRLAEPAAPR